MKRQRSVYLQIGVTLLAVYTVYSFFFWIYQIDQVYKYLSVTSHRWAASYITVGKILLRDDQPDELFPILDEAIEAKEIDYYLIRHKGVDVAFSSSAGADDPILFPETERDEMWETTDYKHFIVHQGDYYYALGYKRNIWAYVRNFYEAEKGQLWANIAFISLFGLALTFYSFRDFREVLRRLTKRSGNRADASIAKSAETFTLIQGLKGYQSNVEALTKENVLLKGQVLPALRKEIASGKTPPYEFGCTMVRTDINNFTTIFSGPGRAEFMNVINEFFVGVTHIVSRYKGYVHEFIGDEVIFYFKDEDHVNSAAIAVAALRDIHRLADQISEETETLGYAFKIKSSVAWGTLRFGPLVDGFALAGKPLIETVRILSHVHEKADNTILFEESLADRVSFIETSREMGVVMLKGLSNSRKLRVHEAFLPLSAQLRQGSDQHFEYASYYRSDSDICETLDYVAKNLFSMPSKSLLKLVSQFREYRVTEFSAYVRNSYLNCYERVLELCDRDEWKIVDNIYLFSSLVTAAAELFPSGTLQGRLRQALLKALEVSDRRVVANALDVFAALDPDAGESVFGKLAAHNDNRIVANALIKEAKRNWSRSVARKVGAVLRVQSPYYKASAVYAIGEIAAFLKKADEVSYQADAHLQTLIDEAAPLLEHANKMVRRQTARMLLKVDRQDALQAVLNDSSVDSDIRAEVRVLASDTVGSQEGSISMATKGIG